MLPLTLTIAMVLSAVLLALSTIAGQEPLIAGNHVMAAQAQALAEAGVERALWALSNPTDPEGAPWSGEAPAPYDGSRFVPVATDAFTPGGFRLTIAGAGDRQRQVLAVGLVPDDSSATRARREISATVIRLRFPNPPAAIAVRGNLAVGEGVTVEASVDGACGAAAGTWSSGATTLAAGSQVRGRTGDPAVPNEPEDALQHQATGPFDDGAFSPAELDAMKAVARVRGTYYQGAVTFDAARRLPDGLIFVDTVSGQPITGSSPVDDLAAVDIGAGAGTGLAGTFRGWIIANGSVSVGGDVTLEGLVYAADRLSQTGAARLVGVAMAGHVRSTAPSMVDARPTGGVAVAASCEAGRTGSGALPQRWLVKPGSYREVAG